jgi:hypothetical protein
MSNAKIRMSNQAQSPNAKKGTHLVLYAGAWKRENAATRMLHHLIFGLWNLTFFLHLSFEI